MGFQHTLRKAANAAVLLPTSLYVKGPGAAHACPARMPALFLYPCPFTAARPSSRAQPATRSAHVRFIPLLGLLPDRKHCLVSVALAALRAPVPPRPAVGGQLLAPEYPPAIPLQRRDDRPAGGAPPEIPVPALVADDGVNPCCVQEDHARCPASVGRVVSRQGRRHGRPFLGRRIGPAVRPLEVPEARPEEQFADHPRLRVGPLVGF